MTEQGKKLLSILKKSNYMMSECLWLSILTSFHIIIKTAI